MATGIVSSAKKQSWSNWSGSVRCQPRELAKPASIDELAALIRRGSKEGRHIRVAGAGHSFTPLVQTDDILISLDNIRGIEQIDRAQMQATVLGGTRLKEVSESLFAHGLAQENLGDINVQSIAGAISTGTHGTGINYGSLATQVVGLTLVTASGEILECSAEQNADIFKAAQVSLGVLGVIVKVVLRVVPAKRLHFISRRERFSDILNNLEKLKQENSHFEFFWMPHTEWVQAKYLNETDEPASEGSTWNTFNRVVLENGVYWLLSEGCRLVPRLARTVSTISAYGIATVNDVDYSHRLFSTPRKVRFQEMEYSIPAEHTRIVLAEIKNYIERYKFAVHFPVECRFVHSDDIWLSPAYEREAAYIAVHMYRGMAYQDYFRRIEEIFKRYEGRPHWGKMHTRTAQELATLYPHWHDFRRIRAELDPAGVFLNDYLRRLFEVEPA